MKRKMFACILLVVGFTLMFSSLAYATSAVGEWRAILRGQARAQIASLGNRQIVARAQVNATAVIPAGGVQARAMIIDSRGQRVSTSAWRVNSSAIGSGQTVTVQEIRRDNVASGSQWRAQSETTRAGMTTLSPITPSILIR